MVIVKAENKVYYGKRICDFSTYTYFGELEALTVSRSGRTYLNLDLCDVSNIMWYVNAYFHCP